MTKLIIGGFTIIFFLLGIFDIKTNLTKFPKSNLPPTTTVVQQIKDARPRVIRIIDGDTIVVLIDSVSEKVRLIGVDTPETVDPRKIVECFGAETSEFTKTMLLNKVVRLESDSSQGDRDRYGRLLRYVFLVDDTNQKEIFVNKKIITDGYGHEYTYRTPYRYQDDFKNFEDTARKLQNGLWGEKCTVG